MNLETEKNSQRANFETAGDQIFLDGEMRRVTVTGHPLDEYQASWYNIYYKESTVTKPEVSQEYSEGPETFHRDWILDRSGIDDRGFHEFCEL